MSLTVQEVRLGHKEDHARDYCDSSPLQSRPAAVLLSKCTNLNMLHMPCLAGQARQRTIEHMQWTIRLHSIARSAVRIADYKSRYMPPLGDLRVTHLKLK